MNRVHTRSILDITGTNMYRTHFNFPSGSIRLATPTSLRRTLLPVIDLSELSIGSLLNRKTSQAWLSASKLPQPLVDLIDIAALPSFQRCCIGAPHREAWILAPTEDVSDCWSLVSCQKQRDEGDSAHVLGIKLRITQQCNDLPQLFSRPSVKRAFLETFTDSLYTMYVQCRTNIHKICTMYVQRLTQML